MEKEVKKTRSWKSRLKVLVVLVLIAAAASAYFYYWYTDTQAMRTEAEANLDKVADYDAMMNKIESEYVRCQQFITQEEGDFSSFEYCKGYVTWYKKNFN